MLRGRRWRGGRRAGGREGRGGFGGTFCVGLGVDRFCSVRIGRIKGYYGGL